MPEDRDPLEALRQAWNQVEAPPSARGLAEEDALTRAAVGWMRAAWEQLDAPAAHAPLRLRLRARGAGVRSAWSRLAAAALLLALGAGLALAPRGAVPQAELTVHSSESSGRSAAGPGPSVDPTPPASASAPPQILDNNRPDRIEMRSGPVHLTLLRPATQPNPTEPSR